MITSGQSANPYFNGHVLNYECISNFETRDGVLQCTCFTVTNSGVPEWDCGSVNFETTCRRSKQYILFNFKFRKSPSLAKTTKKK